MQEQTLTLGQAVRLAHEHQSLTDTVDIAVAVLQAEGALPLDLDDPRNIGSFSWHDVAYSDDALARRHPWLKKHLLCPWCAECMPAKYLVRHAVDVHVGGPIAIEDAGATFDEMDEEFDEDTPDFHGLAVYLQDPWERLHVIEAAREQGLTLNAYMAAALRMVMRHDLRVAEFVRPDPPEVRSRG